MVLMSEKASSCEQQLHHMAVFSSKGGEKSYAFGFTWRRIISIYLLGFCGKSGCDKPPLFLFIYFVCCIDWILPLRTFSFRSGMMGGVYFVGGGEERGRGMYICNGAKRI